MAKKEGERVKEKNGKRKAGEQDVTNLGINAFPYFFLSKRPLIVCNALLYLLQLTVTYATRVIVLSLAENLFLRPGKLSVVKRKGKMHLISIPTRGLCKKKE